MLKPGDPAPPFDLPGALDDQLTRLSLASISAEMVVLFFYPRDFSFICPTEVIGFHKAQADFKAEQTSIVGVSIDDAETHRRWARELGGIAYPLLADDGGKLARAFGILDDQENVALRATFILDPKRTILYAVASPSNVGRSVSETLRVVRALRSGKLCPAGWEPGNDFGPTGAKY
jgi:peroxiredoxin (alkyl hydroperoxide reductase subunit C)